MYKHLNEEGNMIVIKRIENEWHSGIVNLDGTIVYPVSSKRILPVLGTTYFQIWDGTKLEKVVYEKGAELFPDMPIAAILGIKDGYFCVKDESDLWRVYNPSKDLISDEKFKKVRARVSSAKRKVSLETDSFLMYAKMADDKLVAVYTDGSRKSVE